MLPVQQATMYDSSFKIKKNNLNDLVLYFPIKDSRDSVLTHSKKYKAIKINVVIKMLLL